MVGHHRCESVASAVYLLVAVVVWCHLAVPCLGLSLVLGDSSTGYHREVQAIHVADGQAAVHLVARAGSKSFLLKIAYVPTKLTLKNGEEVDGTVSCLMVFNNNLHAAIGTDSSIRTWDLTHYQEIERESYTGGIAHMALDGVNVFGVGPKQHITSVDMTNPTSPARGAGTFSDPSQNSNRIVVTADLGDTVKLAHVCSPGRDMSTFLVSSKVATMWQLVDDSSGVRCKLSAAGNNHIYLSTSAGLTVFTYPSYDSTNQMAQFSMEKTFGFTDVAGATDMAFSNNKLYVVGTALVIYDVTLPLAGVKELFRMGLPSTANAVAVAADGTVFVGSDLGLYMYNEVGGGPPAAPSTPAPATVAPATSAPRTPAPVTAAPVTPAPVTPAPVTPAPVTSAPVTPVPVGQTVVPDTAAPDVAVPPTAVPVLPGETSVPQTQGGSAAPPTALPPPQPTAVTAAPTAVPVTEVPATQPSATQAPIKMSVSDVPVSMTQVPVVAAAVPVPVSGSVLPEGTRDVAGVAGQGATAVSPLGGRLSVVLNLKCEVEDIDLDGERPLDWEFSPTRIPLGSHRHRYFLGAVVFNIIIVVGFYFLNYGIAMVLTAGFGVPLEKALLFTRFPGMTYIAALWLMTGTTLSAANLVFDPVGTPVPVAVFGGIVLAGCIALPVVMWFKLLRPCVFRGVSIPDPKVDRVTAAQLGLAHRLLGGWKRRAYVFLYGANVWVRADGANAVYVEQYGVFFEQYRGGMHWFAVVEMSHVIVVALTSVLKPHTSLTCTLRNAFVVLVLLIYFICVMWLRPFNSRLDQLTTTTMSGSMLVAVFIMTVVLIMHGSPTAAAEPMMDVAAVCLIISAGCVFFKGAYDILLFIFDIHMERRQTAFAVSRQRCPLAFDCGAWGLSPFSSLSATPMFRDMSFDDASIELAMPLTSPEARAAPLDDLCASQMTPLADSDYDSNDPGDFNDMILIRSANVPARCGRPAALSYVSTSTDKTLPLPGSHRRHLSQELPRGRGKVKPVMRPVRSLGSLHSLSAATLLAVEQCPPQVKVLQPEVLL